MLIRVCIERIHRATVTAADLHYVGSLTLDEALLKQSGLQPFQYVHITNVSNGVLWQTCVMAGPSGRGDICLNGPPARHFQKGDKTIVLAAGRFEPNSTKDNDPVIVIVEDNANLCTKTLRAKRLAH